MKQWADVSRASCNTCSLSDWTVLSEMVWKGQIRFTEHVSTYICRT